MAICGARIFPPRVFPRRIFPDALGVAPSAPVVILQPQSQTAYENFPVIFTSSASGSPLPTVQWQKSTNAGINWSNVLGATSTTLSFTCSLNDNNSRYRAVFTNTEGTANSNAAILTVKKSKHQQAGIPTQTDILFAIAQGRLDH